MCACAGNNGKGLPSENVVYAGTTGVTAWNDDVFKFVLSERVLISQCGRGDSAMNKCDNKIGFDI